MPIVSLSNPSYLVVVAAGEPAFPSTSVLDVFTGTDGTELPTYSANWGDVTASGELTIQDNAVGSSVTGSNYWAAATYGPNCEAFITITTQGATGEEHALFIRTANASTWTTAGDGYAVYMTYGAGDDTFGVYRVDDGVFTVLGSAATQAVTNGDSFGIRANGNNFQLYYKIGAGAWNTLGSQQSDSTYNVSGSIILYSSSDASTRLDNFGGGTMP